MAIIYSYPLVSSLDSSNLFPLTATNEENELYVANVTFSTLASEIIDEAFNGTDKYIPRFDGTSSLVNSVIYEDSNGNIGIGTQTPGTSKLKVNGTGLFTDQVTILETPVANTDAASKGYVDTLVTAQDLDFAGTTGTGAVDLDSQTFTIQGTANEIETSAAGQTLTIGLPNNVTVSGDLNVNSDIILSGLIKQNSLVYNQSSTGFTNDAQKFTVAMDGGSEMLELDWDLATFKIGDVDGSRTNSSIQSSSNQYGIDLISNGETMLKLDGFTPTNSFIKLGGTGIANTLDDYEEGSFNPTFTAGSGGGTLSVDFYNLQIGNYVKVGKKVTCVIGIATNQSTVSGTASLQISGLPFTVESTDTNILGGSLSEGGEIDNIANVTAVGRGNNNTSIIFRYNSGAAENDSFITLNISDLQGLGEYIKVLITYFTTQ